MKKRKINVKKLVIFIVFVALIFVGVFLAIKFLFKKVVAPKIEEKEMYVSSITLSQKLYDLEFNEVSEIVRGNKVLVYIKDVTKEESEDNVVYYKIKYNDKEYLVDKSILVDDFKDSALEKEVYVKTPATLYENLETVDIAGLLNKGEKLEVLGFDEMFDTGIINRYNVKCGDKTGYVYSKYLAMTYDEAIANYDQDGLYQKHLARDDTYGGGAAGNLDFYPYEKAKFSDNVMPEEVRSLYLNGGVIGAVDEYIEFAKGSNINAFVVDIKDSGAPSYASPVMQALSPTNYNHAISSFDDYKNAIKKLKDAGFYVIGRITTFKDQYFAEDHPEFSIVNSSNGSLFSHNGSYWPSAYQRDVWEFNVKLAVEAVKEIGFNEIQFDYVRFPDRTYNLEASGAMNMRNDYNEQKAQAIQRFLMYACDEIHAVGAYVSADVFGESAYTYVAAYGQYWPAISNVVDVISAMPYPDHFNAHDFGISEVVWTVPYTLMNTWGSYAAARQAEIPTPAIVRTWLQCYDTIKSPYITYDSSKVADQIQGLYDAGLRGGYMTWNSASSLAKYRFISAAFTRSY